MRHGALLFGATPYQMLITRRPRSAGNEPERGSGWLTKRVAARPSLHSESDTNQIQCEYHYWHSANGRIGPHDADCNLMTKRKQATVVDAALVLSGIVALALASTWALLAIGEGTAAIKFREYGGEFTFGGTFGLFIGLIGVFVKTFKYLIAILSIIVVVSCIPLVTVIQQQYGFLETYRGSPPDIWAYQSDALSPDIAHTDHNCSRICHYVANYLDVTVASTQ
jgi:hypothetical protein